MSTNYFVSPSYWGKYSQSYIALIFLVIFSIIHGSVYSNKLPDNCACHFTFSGDPDGTCSKGSLIGLYIGFVCGLTFLFVGLASIIINMILIDLLTHCRSGMNIPYKEIWLSPSLEEFTISYLTNYFLLLPVLVDSFLIYIFNTLFIYNYRCVSNEDNESSTTDLINPTKENCDYQVHIIIIIVLFIIYMLIYVGIGVGRFFIKPVIHDEELIEPHVIEMRDEDYCCGGCYCNPRDSRVFIPKRFGFGWSLNMGRVACLMFVALLFVFIVFILGIGDTFFGLS